ncbi:hypothetical protein DENSPDRAFT_799321 [Dentipellis sp. KUC8613]|nr:hypothetical protein DENSPDRAFT_799321 [Dentipellis sp. KUC8613]
MSLDIFRASPSVSMQSNISIDSDDDSDLLSVHSHSVSSFPSSHSSATSYNVSMRSASPAPSVYSITSSLRAQSFRHEFGRGVNNYSDIYRLPADDEEFDRLDKQHIMFMDIMGKYPPPLPEIMADDTPGETKNCLDLGCGSGSWIMDVARDFPNCQAVAVDLVPMQAKSVQQLDFHLRVFDDLPTELSDMPDNLRSEVDDINLGLQHFYGDFNVVHARLISSGIRDYHALIHQISQTLRPGGLIDLMEFDFRVYDAHHNVISPFLDPSEGSWLSRWMYSLGVAVRQRGGTTDASNVLYAWVMEHPALEEVVYRDFYLQTSPFFSRHEPHYARNQVIGHYMRDDILAFLKSGRPLLLGSSQMSVAEVDELESHARAELADARKRTYIRIENVYARKVPNP